MPSSSPTVKLHQGRRSPSCVPFQKTKRQKSRRIVDGFTNTLLPPASPPQQSGNQANPGVIPQAVAEIFTYIQSHPEKTYLLRASYLEIYNETLKDLLAPDAGPLRIRQDEKVRNFDLKRRKADLST